MKGRRARRQVAEPGPQALAVLAGLPVGIAELAVKRLTAAHTSWQAVSVPFAKREEGVYRQDRTIRDLMLQSAFFASALSAGATSVPSPARILLLSVELPDCQRLLDAFGFSVLNAPLRTEGWDWPGGRHWRHDIDVTMKAIESAMRMA